MEIEDELNMRGNFVGFVKQKLNLKSKEDDVLEIHKLPSKNEGPKSIIVKFEVPYKLVSLLGLGLTATEQADTIQNM